MTILPVPGIIQNLAAPAVVGTLVGIIATFFYNKPASFLKRMPSFLAELFIIPGIIGGLLAMIFISCYGIPSYNKIVNFPFPQFISTPGKYILLELVILVCVILIASIAALLNILICLLIRCCRLKQDLLEPDFVMVEDSEFLLAPSDNYNQPGEYRQRGDQQRAYPQ